ncbi:flagellar biosynthetic protein FlhB [mine drainage metagenome]|uniref:Flagellar biosynthetic protein FlhB n=1 Tax=mine drainage metagenome TaxID=410659 RepID=A0A1J5PQX7_9ZZZZ
MSGGADKSEKPTPRKLKEARREGRIAKTPEVGGWAGLLAVTFVLPRLFSSTQTTTTQLMAKVPATIADPDPAKALALLSKALKDGALVLAPFLMTLLVVGVLSTAAQGGIHVSTKRFRPKLERFNPLHAAKRIFGLQGGWELVKALLKSIVAAYLVWQAARKLTLLLLGQGGMSLGIALTDTASAAIALLRVVALVALILGFVDYGVAWRRSRKQIMMTRREVTDEYRSSDGDPQVKAEIRARAKAMAKNRMMQDVARADVVLINPTHVAVALRYDPTRGAPRVVAKGRGVVATRIRQLAAENRVPMVEDIPLARALHAACEIGQEIPADFYNAVAKVLAFVMSLRARGSAAGVHRATTLLKTRRGR